MHSGILANPQGNEIPAFTTLHYDALKQSYETDAEYRQRVRTDLQKNSELMERELGVRPRAVIWPFGRFSHLLTDIAAELGRRRNRHCQR